MVHAPTKTNMVTDAWRRPVFFRDWQAVLNLEPFSPDEKAATMRGVIAFLSHCKKTGRLASIALAKDYLDAGLADGHLNESHRLALRWFFRTYRREQQKHGAPAYPVKPPPPPPMPIPAGTPEWLARMMRRIRLRGLLWTTEQSYCGWLRQFARFVAPATPDQLGASEVRDFLTHLAVDRRVSANTQRQALNALVFFFREALQRDLGDLGDFKRPPPWRRMPVVLARDEIDTLIDALRGTWRLMAHLQYGSGLRVTLISRGVASWSGARATRNA